MLLIIKYFLFFTGIRFNSPLRQEGSGHRISQMSFRTFLGGAKEEEAVISMKLSCCRVKRVLQ